MTGIASLKGIRETEEGLEIGALTTLAEVENSPIVREKYSLLSTAAGRVASPQIRNAGTLGGNLCQDTRCWYYRYGVSCYRAGGITCYADTPEGQNREHCLFGASRCVAVSPSDTATASVALDAKMVIHGPDGERIVPAEEFFIGPSKDITRMNVLKPGEVLTAVRYPKAWAGAKFYFEKVTDRNTWDFALVSVAAAMVLDGDDDQEHSPRVWRGRMRAAPAQGFGEHRDGSEEGRGRRHRSRQGRIAWRHAASVQPLQGAADGEPRPSRHP